MQCLVVNHGPYYLVKMQVSHVSLSNLEQSYFLLSSKSQ
uniref:Uncharacterized protein n=1 Tax=Rhizophora mucronata TaxID=61149 RepID=A0A2P2PPS1_RHIMU